MKRPWKVALVAGLVGLVLGLVLRDLIVSPGKAGNPSALALPGPPTAAYETRTAEVAEPARIDTAPIVAGPTRERADTPSPNPPNLVTGRVWDPAREPAAGARVTLRLAVIQDGKETLLRVREVRSDEQGQVIEELGTVRLRPGETTQLQ